MEVPESIILTILGILIATVGTVVSYFMKQLIFEVRELRKHLTNVDANLSKIDLVVAKAMLILTTCKNCPHPNFDAIELAAKRINDETHG